MDEPEDELDLRHYRNLKPDVYYRCPTLESLDGALRNEFARNASILIPVEIVTEFVFATASTITIPVTQQPNLDQLFEPADYPQSITVDLALCRTVQGRDRLKAQRAIARSVIGAIQEIDGFKYSERHASNKSHADGLRFKYVCVDSLQNRDRVSNTKKGTQGGEKCAGKERKTSRLPTYDCGGAINIKFSIKREAVNVIYVHNPIHRDVESRPVNEDIQFPDPVGDQGNQGTANSTPNGTKQRKRKRSKKDQADVENAFHAPNLDGSTSPGATKTPAQKKCRQSSAAGSQATRKSSTKKGKKAKQTQSPSAGRNAPTSDPSPEPPAKPKTKSITCLRCREKKTKCNEARPTCNQCARGLWTCQYETTGPRKRSKNGCLNCKQRKRKCTEEKPYCAYCLKVDDDCEYPDYA